MKHLKPLYFAIGMAGLFSIALSEQTPWLATLSTMSSFAITSALSLALAALLTWLTQFQRRHIGSTLPLQAFAGCGLLVIALHSPALQIPSPLWSTLATSVPQLALFGLFCLIALHTQPTSDTLESAL